MTELTGYQLERACEQALEDGLQDAALDREGGKGYVWATRAIRAVYERLPGDRKLGLREGMALGKAAVTALRDPRLRAELTHQQQLTSAEANRSESLESQLAGCASRIAQLEGELYATQAVRDFVQQQRDEARAEVARLSSGDTPQSRGEGESSSHGEDDSAVASGEDASENGRDGGLPGSAAPKPICGPTTPAKPLPPTSAALGERIADLEELLACIWLYVHWRYVTKQLTTEQKEMWANAVDCGFDRIERGDGPVADRWWRPESPADEPTTEETDRA